jgi:uncharacterized membrane protein required for colicin V production
MYRGPPDAGNGGQLTGVNFLDWVLIALFAIGAIWGYRKGLVDAALLAASIYIALLLSGQFAGRVLGLIWKDVESEALNTAIGYVIIFVGVFIAGRVLSAIIKKSLKAVYAGWVDKAGGIVVGLVIGLLLTGGLTAALARYTYVVDKEGAGNPDSGDPNFVEQMKNAAEDFLVDSARENFDEWLTRSEVVGVLLDVRDALPGSALGIAPEDFNTALDILESKRADLDETAD